jgi:hypothetical protein
MNAKGLKTELNRLIKKLVILGANLWRNISHVWNSGFERKIW